MSETAILAAVVAALWSIAFALVAVVWTTLKERNTALEMRADRLERQNLDQEVQLGRLIEMAKAREESHATHREDTSAAISRLEAAIENLGRKIDRLTGQGTPMPRNYGTSGGDKR